MINLKNKIFPVILCIVCYATPGHAQFLNFEINIEPEISTTVQNKLAFGQFPANAGSQIVNLGDPNMGIFELKGFFNQKVILNAQFPSQLTQQNSLVTDIIPVTLQAAYNNKGQNDFRETTTFKTNTAGFKILDTKASTASSDIQSWEAAYIYIFGSIYVGNIQSGIYEGNATLSVFYQ